MLSRTATTRLVADILDLLERDWIAWANVLELLAYASSLKPVVRLVANTASREVLAEFCQRQHWSWRWSGFWLEPVFHTPLNDTFTRLVYSHAPADSDRVLFVGHEAVTRRTARRMPGWRGLTRPSWMNTACVSWRTSSVRA